jgi:ribonuclease BN (tRNA processing enzyme)
VEVMKIEVLGCYGNIIGDYRATAFLINDSVLLDAGTVTEVLDDERLKRIRHVLISHTHIDHLKGLFPLVDELVMMDGCSFELVSTAGILKNISDNLFNDLIWPDFTAIPSEHRAVMRLREIKADEASAVGGLMVQPVPVSHTVECVGHVIREGNTSFMYTADTRPTETFWRIASKEQGTAFIIADVSFPDRLEELAENSGHMTLSMLVNSLERFGLSQTKVFISHMKPVFMDEIFSDLARHHRSNIKPLEQGTIFDL